ncbi:MAG TPA: hypothetical protein DCM86_08905 [Verrucomicrobiales bacterium]|nr:hypothetical protein [Verrucomicrobiales bacterium]
MATTKHCHKCGWEWPLSPLPGRNDSCHQCGADMKVCLNCVSYDARAAYQCRDRRADPVAEKHSANFCEYFDFLRREWKGASTDSREQGARDQLRKLFGD